MPVHRVRLLGDPILRAKCAPVKNPKSPAVRLVADDLHETLSDLKARLGMGRGLSAPQIGAPLRLVYVHLDAPWFLVNPEIVDIGTADFHVWDDCFSAPQLLVRVQRAWEIRVRYQDLSGNEHELDARKELAELLQHEIDHLDGVLTVDRPVGLDPFCYREEWQKHHPGERRYGRKFTRRMDAALEVVGSETL